MLLRVRAVPRASRTALAGCRSAALIVRVQAPPVEGAANEAILRFLARDLLDVAKSSVLLVRGEKDRDKLLAVYGVEVEVLRARIQAALLSK